LKIVVLEDNGVVRNAVEASLRRAGFGVDSAADLPRLEQLLDIYTYDLAILDRTVPSGDALAFVQSRRVRGWRTPVLFVTALDSVDERVKGFASGGDDYLVKPFAMEELVARAKSLVRRTDNIRNPIATFADLTCDWATGEVRRNGILLPLTAKESAILELLMKDPGVIVSRTMIIDHCWDEITDPMSNVVDVHMASLRRKLGEPSLIATRRGEGYRMQTP
jgi:DNA-binding response OmpR family regulator